MRSKFRTIPYLAFLFPLDVLAGLLIVLSMPWWLRKRRATHTGRVDASKTTIIIVNWDGKHLLEECLPAVIQAVNHDGGSHEILVVDNGSTDGSVELIKTK